MQVSARAGIRNFQKRAGKNEFKISFNRFVRPVSIRRSAKHSLFFYLVLCGEREPTAQKN